MSKQIPILSEEQIALKLRRMAFEIYEQNSEEDELVLIGIQEGGAIMAKNLQAILQAISPLKTTLIQLKVNKKFPLEDQLTIDFPLTGKSIVLIDDVANSGRTLMYALRPLLVYAPARIKVAVLMDRKHKNFPINPDIIGHSVSTTLQDRIVVTYKDDQLTGALLE